MLVFSFSFDDLMLSKGWHSELDKIAIWKEMKRIGLTIGIVSKRTLGTVPSVHFGSGQSFFDGKHSCLI